MPTGPSPAVLRDLLERVRAATGPDREIDAEVWWLFADKIGTDRDVLRVAEKLGVGAALNKYSGTIWARGSRPERYTESLDAALALVGHVLPTGWWIQLRAGSDFQSEAWCERPSRLAELHHGETLALAILAALLSAKLALLTQDAPDAE